MAYIIIALSIFHYLDNTDNLYKRYVFNIKKICKIKKYDKNIQLELYYDNNNLVTNMKEVVNFGGYHYKIINNYYLSDEIIEKLYSNSDVTCDIFEISHTRNNYTIDMNKFEPSPRVKLSRMVWIFKGKSGAGKSYLAHLIKGKTVYETDSCSTLPDNINADIVILGNKYKFDIEDIKEKIVGPYELHIVDFS